MSEIFIDRDTIIKLAREAGFETGVVTDAIYAPASCRTELEHFAAMVAAAERDACAQVCEASASRLFAGKSRVNQVDRHTAAVLCRQAEAIRARSKNDMA